MLTSAAEIVRRRASRVTSRLHSLPVLALSVHSACNCRCIMCDIWKANAEKREIARATLERHLAAIRRLHVQRVMFTGGEPLLHSNLWALCDLLLSEGVRLTLVTTGLLLAPHAAAIARRFDQVVVSIDGPADTHDAIRRTRGGLARLVDGIRALQEHPAAPTVTARSVIQRANASRIADTIAAVQQTGCGRVSFLAADVTSTAFNRPDTWSPARQAEIALSLEDLPALATAIETAARACPHAFRSGFVVGGVRSLWRIHDYYRALAGAGALPPIRCHAPWVSAVLEPDGAVRPCFFHAPYPRAPGGALDETLNSPGAVAFRRGLDVTRDETCRRCVCTLSLPVWASV